MWWLWGSLIVSSVHLLEELLFFERPGLHHRYFGFEGPEHWSAFAIATGKQTLFHLVGVLVAARAGGRWRRYITQFFVVVLWVMSGLLFIVEMFANGGYIAGVVTGVLVVTPFLLLGMIDLLRQGAMTRRGLAAWLVLTPALSLAVIYGWLL